MNKLIIILFTALLILGCENRDSNDNNEPITENPIEDIGWLNDMKDSLTGCVCEISIIQGTYKDQTVFYTALTDPLCDGIYPPVLFDVDGKVIREYTFDDWQESFEDIEIDSVLYRCNQQTNTLSDAPREDQDWIEAIIDSLTNCFCEISLIQGTYNNQTVYFVSMTDPICDGFGNRVLFDTNGNVVKIYDNEMDSFDEVTSDTVLYRCKNDGHIEGYKGYAWVIGFNPEKCGCCWGWTVRFDDKTIKLSDGTLGKKIGYDFADPIKVYIEIGELEEKCSSESVTDSKETLDYYEVLNLVKID